MTTKLSILTDTWDVGATVFTAIKMTITDTDFAVGSQMIDITTTVAGGYFRVDPNGNMAISGQLDLSAGGFGNTKGVKIGANTFIYESAEDNFVIEVGGVEAFRLTETAGEVVVTFAPFQRHVFIPSSAATAGVSAPSPLTIGTSRGLQFAIDSEEAFLAVNIPSDWDGASDMTLEVHWAADPGDLIEDAETVKWDVTYHSTSNGEAVDEGTVATGTATHTQVGAGTDKELYDTEITLPYTGGNQPLTAGDHLFIQFDRDVTGDTYSGAPVVLEWHVMYTSVRIPQG